MKEISLVNLETKIEFNFKRLNGLNGFFPNQGDSSSQVKNLAYGLLEVATIFGYPFCLKGNSPKRYEIKDLITGKTFTAYFLKDLAKISNLKSWQVSKLMSENLNGDNTCDCIESRYINLFRSKIFVVVDYFSGKEYECFDAWTFFLHLNAPYDKKISNGFFQAKRKGGAFSFQGRVFYFKGSKPKNIRPNAVDPNLMLEYKNKLKIQQKIGNRLRKRINNCQGKKYFQKNNSTFELLGCSPEFFLEHLENQFTKGMTWDNYGLERINKEKSWHIDHIAPCNTFDLTDPEQQKKCFHYSNMRPLWESENLKRPRDGRDIK